MFDIFGDVTSGNSESVSLDWDKFRNYVEINMAIGYKINGNLSYHIIPFKQCKVSDFKGYYDGKDQTQINNA